MPQNILYFMEDPRLPNSCKIGKDTQWPQRFKQARSHNPSALKIRFLISFQRADSLANAERELRNRLADYRRQGDVKEWFDIGAERVISELSGELPWLGEAKVSKPIVWDKPQQKFYDDLRDLAKRTKKSENRHCRWHIWLFKELSSHARYKISVGSLFDTQFTYAFTYNPHPVRLVAGFEHRSGINEISEDNAGPNEDLVRIWNDLLSFYECGQNEQVGWLPEGIDEQQIANLFAKYPISAIPLDRPKPIWVRPKDPSLKMIAPGAIPSQRRVLPSVLF
ncbi:GIY-YIG nuclease family protein [Roseibium sp. RKSG952]|uniref:GIY-YIG nuclease family protein n=1 Tax=Roseibium sp. RKSG952 TaxID=2529384 RepID=UPI0012BD5904|nr:GIY-YIG nuclease family protein [Roseibium sp. RKSG952]MTH94968.1 hypothetical protein [Roseibium sp. RKSG952]